uniref:CUB domain-containing protein n=1 Tax=Steinernema glaseri TaxID=37863 RepID=A0A1I7ZEG7_9BILA
MRLTAPPNAWLRFLVAAVLFVPLIADTIVPLEPQISYFDGRGRRDTCRTKPERRVSGEAGIIISHQLYGTVPYNASKNCFLVITVPVGYRIRLRALDFNVNGDPSKCDKDSLHVFDNEKDVIPKDMDEINQEETLPGPIIGKFCGSLNNHTEFAVSTSNTLTLWWHSDFALPAKHDGEGFRLYWSAFRTNKGRKCAAGKEFQCRNKDCIPTALACNRYQDCIDKSDLDKALQLQNKCEYVAESALGSLNGIAILLICSASVLTCICTCVGLCVCCRCMRPVGKAPFPQSDLKTVYSGSEPSNPPNPPGFYPPSPPKMPPPNVHCYSPHRTQHFSSQLPGCSTPITSTVTNNECPHANRARKPMPEYGGPQEHTHSPLTGCAGEGGDYTYVRAETRRLLL